MGSNQIWKFPSAVETYHVVCMMSKKMVVKSLYFVFADVESVASFSYFTATSYYCGEFSFFS